VTDCTIVIAIIANYLGSFGLAAGFMCHVRFVDVS